MTLTFLKTEVRNENWVWHHFQDQVGFKFFVKEPKGEIKIKKEKRLSSEKNSELYQLEWKTCITLSKEKVAEGWYREFYEKGKTDEQIFSNVKKGIADVSGCISSSQEHLDKIIKMTEEIENSYKENPEPEFINQNGLKITESFLNDIFLEYFSGTGLENVEYNWAEIINLPGYTSCAADLANWKNLNVLNKTKALADLLVQLKASRNSIAGTDKKKYTRLLKENEIKKWILEKGINYKHLKKAFENNHSKRIIYNYKIDNQEEIAWFGEITEIFNYKFGSNWTPVEVFGFITGSLLGLAWIGYFFISKIKTVIRNRGVNLRQV